MIPGFADMFAHIPRAISMITGAIGCFVQNVNIKQYFYAGQCIGKFIYQVVQRKYLEEQDELFPAL